jgi:hypothetical protein
MAPLEEVMKISTAFSNTSVHPLLRVSCQVAKRLWDNASNSLLNIMFSFRLHGLFEQTYIVEKSSHKNSCTIKSRDRGD